MPELAISAKEMKKDTKIGAVDMGRVSTLKNNFVEQATARGKHQTDEDKIKYLRCKCPVLRLAPQHGLGLAGNAVAKEVCN